MSKTSQRNRQRAQDLQKCYEAGYTAGFKGDWDDSMIYCKTGENKFKLGFKHGERDYEEVQQKLKEEKEAEETTEA